ncbi:DUF2637 domain-containing protein [Streptomyces regalis]|uniref:DUF2637 domain-containing protein n=1 Tax=Streptomyces regalis TaxID=68262 RepID=A0A101JH05_9ACTN|nr:DUF2637 domain-containing protein [Streptomyces regalis]KUL26627.1 hypothetical protein ADL12_32230 [Streptomyces regalis]
MKINPSRALAIGAGLVIVALTAAAFWLSYAHLAEVALAHGMEDKEIRAWAWPATLDLFIVAGELLMLRAALAGRVDRWAIGLTVVGSGSSIALNVAGVGSAAEPLDYVVAAVPPTAALLAFGALMRQIHQALAEHAQPQPPPPLEEVTEAPEVTVERVDDDQPRALLEAPEVVPAGARMLPIVALPAPERTFVFDHSRQQYMPSGSTNGYQDWPAPEEPEVVTEVVTLTPSELRRRAAKLNRELVASTNRPVTIERLREEFGLSRREAAELRREVVATVALIPGEVRS